jgi:hypothetical protein
VSGTVPATYAAASQGATAARPSRSRTRAQIGVTTMPPIESPVETTDMAMERFRTNQCATTVMAGTSEVAAKPSANTA